METSLKTLLTDANQEIESLTVAEAQSKLEDSNYVFIDVREHPELNDDGQIPDALHIPRGLLEFTVDAAGPYYNNIFASDKNFIFYCKTGGRSALAAKVAKDLGVKNVINLVGGFQAWKEQ